MTSCPLPSFPGQTAWLRSGATRSVGAVGERLGLRAPRSMRRWSRRTSACWSSSSRQALNQRRSCRTVLGATWCSLSQTREPLTLAAKVHLPLTREVMPPWKPATVEPMRLTREAMPRSGKMRARRPTPAAPRIQAEAGARTCCCWPRPVAPMHPEVEHLRIPARTRAEGVTADAAAGPRVVKPKEGHSCWLWGSLPPCACDVVVPERRPSSCAKGRATECGAGRTAMGRKRDSAMRRAAYVSRCRFSIWHPVVSALNSSSITHRARYASTTAATWSALSIGLLATKYQEIGGSATFVSISGRKRWNCKIGTR